MDRRHPNAARWWRQTVALLTCAALASCDTGSRVTGQDTDGNHDVRLGLRGAVIAAPGAVFEAVVSTTTVNETQLVIARDSVVITTGGDATTLTLTADIGGCLQAAAALGSNTCSLRLTTRLKRDGVLLDESIQTLTVNASTLSITATPVQLFEVETVVLTPSTLPALEPGDSVQLTAVARDRSGQTVTGRSLNFSVISGGVAVSNTGMLRALTPGAARIRASMGGRLAELAFTVQPTGVANLTIAPLDTTVIAGASFSYAVVARSATGEILTGRTINFASSNANTATVSLTGGVVTTLNAGTTTITASTPDGPAGATRTATATLTVLARPVIAFSPSALGFDTEIGQPIPVAKLVTVQNGGAGNIGTLSVDSVGPGITAVLSSGLPPNSLSVRPTAALAPGVTLNTVVRVRSTAQGVSPALLPVTVTGLQPPPIILSKNTVAFNNIPVGGSSDNVNVSVTTTSGRVLSGLSASVLYTPSAPAWLTATLLTTSTSTSLALSANAELLTVGTYVADVTIASLTDPHIPATVRVTLQVVAVPRVVLSTKVVNIGPLNPNVSPGPITNVNVLSGLATPLTGLVAQVQYLNIQNQWLSASLLTTTTPATLRFTPIPSGLPPGQYQARVIVYTTTQNVAPDTAMVTLTVAAPVVWAKVAAGDSHTCALATGGEAYCWGINSDGQLGNGTTTASNVPVRVAGATLFVDITTSGNHTCAVTSGGMAYCWGLNDEGQVGVGTLTNVLVPTAVSGGRQFTTVKAGWRHTCGITSSIQLFCWGNNARGQLGNGTTTRTTTPSLMPGASDARELFLGVDFSCYRDSDFSGYCTGRNDLGQLGFGIGSDELQPVYADLYYQNYTAGGFHACGMYSSQAYCWGNNYWGQLGVDDSETGTHPAPVLGQIVFNELSGGYGHTCGRSDSNHLYCWGNNADGQLGYGSIGGVSPVPQAVASQLQFVEVRAGGGHSCALTAAGALYCWGENVAGQLGNGLNSNSGLMVAVAPTIITPSSGGIRAASSCVVGPTSCAATSTRAPVRRIRKEPPRSPAALRPAIHPIKKKR